MRMLSILAVIGFAISLPVGAEPYAEWGVFANGKSLSEFETGIRVPEASEVPIPLAPGGVFISTSGSTHCAMNIRTDHSLAEVCSFYESHLRAPDYLRVEEMEAKAGGGCALYKGGETRQSTGVWVYTQDSSMFNANGTTNILIEYHTSGGKECGS